MSHHLFEILGHHARLEVLSLLVRRHPSYVSAGEIGDVLGLRPSTLSNYLAALMRVEAIEQQRRGTSLGYRANMSSLRAQFDGVLNGPLNGRRDVLVQKQPPVEAPFKIAFICSGNSGRSQLAQAAFAARGSAAYTVYSAGTSPSARLNADVAQYIAQHEGTAAQYYPKACDDPHVPWGQLDIIITLCDYAANERCVSGTPAWAYRAHWPVAKTDWARGPSVLDPLWGQFQTWAARLEDLVAHHFDPVAFATALDTLPQQGT